MIFLIYFIQYYNVYAGEIALTFDDVPQKSQALDAMVRTDKILEALRKNQVFQSAFFVNTVRLDRSGKKRIKKYAKAGHIIANHSHSHLDLDKVGYNAFLNDFDIADRILSKEKGFKNWFRYPFLHEGRDITLRDKVHKEIVKRKYFNAYVTVDNYDWYFDKLYQKAIAENKPIDSEKLCATYSDILWQAIKFYDDIALAIIKRSPKHVLLLHENDSAAICLNSLMRSIRDNNWHIIGIEDAYSDPISLEQPDVLQNNQGRIVSIAILNGYTGVTKHPLENEKNLEQYFLTRVF